MSTKVDWNYCGEPYVIEDGISKYNYPKKSGEYLITSRRGDVTTDMYNAYYCDWGLFDGEGEVVAWAELPPPYKED